MYLTPNYNFHVPDTPASLFQQLKLLADDVDAALAEMSVTSTEGVWKFETTNTMADPGTGDVRTNTPVVGSTTQLAISRITQNGIDRRSLLLSLIENDTINFQDQANPNNWGRFHVAGQPTDNGSWFLIPVTTVDYGGTTPGNNQNVLLDFTQSGGGTGGGGGGGGTVTSVFGRIGAVTAQFNDYPVVLGGTGISTYTTGDLLYASGGTVLSKLPDVATGNALISGGVGGAPSWGKIDLTQHTSGMLPPASGGIGNLAPFVIGDILFADSTTTLAKLADKATFNVLISGGVGVAPAWGKVNLNNAVTGLLPVTSGGTGTTTVFTAGSVIFARAAGLYTESNAQFFWDNTNFRLGLGTAAPVYKLDVTGVGHFTGGLLLDVPLGVTSGGTGTGTAFTQGSVHFAGPSGVFAQNNAQFFWDNTNNRLGLGTNAPASQLHLGVGIITMETSTTSKFRIQTISGVGQWSGITMNQYYTTAWNLDDTTKEGFQLSIISGTVAGQGGVTINYTPPGPNPHSDGYGLVTINRDSMALTMKPSVTLYLLDSLTGFLVAGSLVIRPLANNALWSTTYTSGLSGWAINALGDAEFNNVSIRGELRTSVFKVNEIAATAGTFGVFYSASTLTADCTTAAAYGNNFTFTAKNSDMTATARLFSVGDIVRFKAFIGQTGVVIGDSWATIAGWVNNGPTTTYTATLNGGSGSTTFRAGTAVLDYGPSGTGFITLSTDGTVGATPNMTMATHAGQPWSAFTIATRVGNLNGSYGYTSAVYGFGAGQYGGTAPALINYTPANVAGGSFTGGVFTKSAATGWANSGFSSVQSLAGDGYIEWRHSPSINDGWMCGLSYADPNTDYTTINFAWHTSGGNALIYENGGGGINCGPILVNVTVLRIWRTGTVITYYKDGVAQRSVPCTTAPLFIDCSVYAQNGQIGPLTFYNANSYGWVVVDNVNGVRIGGGGVTRIALLPDGSGYLASGNIKWDATGATTIAGWTINQYSISSGATYIASNFDIPAGQVAWFGKSVTFAYSGWYIRDAAGRGMYALVGNQGIYPYMGVTDTTRNRITIGGLNYAFGSDGATDSVGMKIWDSAGNLLVRFSDAVANGGNMIAGWTIAQTSINSITSGTGVSLNSGASAGLTCLVGNVTVASVDGSRGFDTKIDSGTTGFNMTRCYTISDLAIGGTIASFHAIEFSTTENITYLQTWPITGRNSDTMLVSSAPAGKTAWIDLSCQVGGTTVVEMSLLSANGFQYWANAKKRVDIDLGTSMNFYTNNLVVWVPQDGTTYGVLFANTATGGGCGGIKQFTSGAYSQVQVNSNAPTGGNTQHGLVYFTSADNSNQNSANFYLVSELNLGSRVACYPVTGTFKGFLISDVLVDGPAPFAGALFQLNSTTKGFLMPRMTIAQRNAIGAQNGTMVFNTDNQVPSFVCSGAWRDLVRGVLTRVSSTVNLTCPNGATTLLNFNDENLDPDGMWDSGFPSGIAPRTLAGAGTYLITGNVQMIAGSPAVGYSQLQIIKNRGAAGQVILGCCTLQNTGNHTTLEVSTIGTLNVNDYVELMFYNGSGGTVTLAGASPQTPCFWVLKISGFSG